MEMDCISFFTIFSPHVNSGISVKLVSSTGAAAASPVRDTPYKELDTIPEVECPPPCGATAVARTGGSLHALPACAYGASTHGTGMSAPPQERHRRFSLRKAVKPPGRMIRDWAAAGEMMDSAAATWRAERSGTPARFR